jgi:hypothetical protein
VTLEEAHLIRIGGRDHLRIPAGQRDLETAGRKPSATRYILRVAELRRSDLLAAKIAWAAQLGIRLHDQRRTTFNGAGDDADIFTSRLRIRVYGGAGADIG